MAHANQYHLKIEGPGITLNREVTEGLATRIFLMALNYKEESVSSVTYRAGKQVDDLITPSVDHANNESPRDFLLNHKAKKVTEKIVTLAYYLKEHKNSQTFSKNDLVSAFEQAAEPVPANLTRDIFATKRIEWISPKKGARGSYYITSSGIEAVEMKFPSELRRKPYGNSKRKINSK